MKISSNNNNNNNDKYSKFYLPHSSFKQVCKIAQDYNIKIVHRLKEGKYIILGRIMFVRVSITWKASFVHFKILLLQEISLPHNGFGLPNPPPPPLTPERDSKAFKCWPCLRQSCSFCYPYDCRIDHFNILKFIFGSKAWVNKTKEN